MRNKILLGVMILFAVTGIFAQQRTQTPPGQQAIIKDFTGTVELQLPNTTRWVTANKGQAMTVDTIVSTGFKSFAVITIGDSVLNVRPLTRLSIKELSTMAGTENINIGLQAGRVRADVNQPVGTNSNFAFQSPVATASTRGTIFEVDTCTLWVIEGSIEYTGTSGSPVVVDAGGFSYIDENSGKAAPPIETMHATLNPVPPIGSDLFNSFDGAGSSPNILNVFAYIGGFE